MRLSSFLFALVVLMATIIGIKYLRTPPVPLKELSAGSVLLAFGDSLTYGFGALPDESYPAELERRIGHTVINAGVSGELSAQGLDRLPSVLDRYHPDILLLCHGGNDILGKKDKAALRANLEKMIQMARARNIDVILIAVPEFSFFHLAPDPLYDEIARRFQLPIESDVLSDVLQDNRYKSDTIHPNALGYEKMAEAMEKLLRKYYRFKEGERK